MTLTPQPHFSEPLLPLIDQQPSEPATGADEDGIVLSTGSSDVSAHKDEAPFDLAHPSDILRARRHHFLIV